MGETFKIVEMGNEDVDAVQVSRMECSAFVARAYGSLFPPIEIPEFRYGNGSRVIHGDIRKRLLAKFPIAVVGRLEEGEGDSVESDDRTDGDDQALAYPAVF